MYKELAAVRAELSSAGQMFEIEEIEVRGTRVKSWRHAPATLRDFWLQSAAHGDAEYLVYNDERWTYREAHDLVNRVASWLTANDIGRHDRVAIAMRNYPEWLLAYWATLSAGATVVGVNAWWVAEEMRYGLCDANPKLIIADQERIARLDQVRSDLPEHLLVGVRCDAALSDNLIPWETVTAHEGPLPDPKVEPDDDACIFYTSGTTGRPKGAQLTHRGCTNNIMSAVFSNLSQATALARLAGKEYSTPDKTAVLLTTPLFHVTANNVIAHSNTLLGNKLVHMYKWDAAEAIRLIEREKISSLSGVPVMAREVLAHPDYAKADTSSLAAVGGGGAPVQPDLVSKIEGGSSATPVSAYGMTEICGLATGIAGQFFLERPESVGPVLPIFDVKCVDADGNDVAQGERGEVLLKGAQVIKGYLNRADATAESIVDGWLHTGDIGYLDSEGFLYIVDRAKDMVLRGGENIYCAEVEAVFYKLESVAEAAVFAVPDDIMGEEVGVALYLKPNTSLAVAELREFCTQHLAAYKIPRYIWLLNTPIPRNASGKFLKKDLQSTLNKADAV